MIAINIAYSIWKIKFMGFFFFFLEGVVANSVMNNDSTIRLKV